VCDDLAPNGDYTCSWQDKEEQITAEANNPSGGGGKGQRKWLGDGVNDGSGGTKVNFNTPQSDVWIRWYARFQPGFKWSTYEGFKMVYMFKTGGGSGPLYYTIAYNSDWLSMYPQTGGTQVPSAYLDSLNHYHCNGCGWLSLFPSGQSDGSWHAFEIHAKIESPGKNDGVFQAWVDGRIVIDANTVNYGMADNGYLFSNFTIGSNAKTPNNGGCAYVDFDDIAVRNTGYIGLLKEGGENQSARPSAPVNLQ
jgi:hypothetical protein